MATVRITAKAGWKAPLGRRSATAASGTKTPSSFTVPEPVARMAKVCQSSSRLTPSAFRGTGRSEEHTSELQSLMRISYAVFCLKKKKNTHTPPPTQTHQHSIQETIQQ